MVTASMDVLDWLRKQLKEADTDLLREMVGSFVQTLMGAEADAVCGAAYGERSRERSNSRNGYRVRDWDTRVGSLELAIPKLRQGSYFPDWLLQPRRRAERALVAVVAEALPGGRLHPAGGRPGPDLGHRADVQVAGLRAGQEPG